MAFSPAANWGDRLEFDAGEVTGAVGDSVTILPLVVGLALLTEVSLPHVLVAFGVFQVLWGVVYGLPIAVEPMKALAALAIAGALSYAELALAGVFLGVLLLGIGLTGTLARLAPWIGDPVIRGVQFAVALLLVETGLGLAADDPVLAGAGVVLAAAAALVGYGNASAIVVLAVGAAAALWTAGIPAPQLPGAPPLPALAEGATRRAADGVLAQLAMTVGNAALATSLLLGELFDEEVTPDELSTTMGVTNLLAIPLGGIPMCHGCDGVAGKYEFGARTGGANVVIGAAFLVGSLFASTALLEAFPLAMLGVLLAIVAVSLGSSVRRSSNVALSVGVGALALVSNLGVAFLAGVVAHLLLERANGDGGRE